MTRSLSIPLSSPGMVKYFSIIQCAGLWRMAEQALVNIPCDVTLVYDISPFINHPGMEQIIETHLVERGWSRLANGHWQCKGCRDASDQNMIFRWFGFPISGKSDGVNNGK